MVAQAELFVECCTVGAQTTAADVVGAGVVDRAAFLLWVGVVAVLLVTAVDGH